MGFPSFVNNAEVGGKIWLFWASEVDFQLTACSDQAISGWFVFGSTRIFSSFVYASCFREKRVELWDYLRVQDPQGQPWFIGGDFNIIRTDSEKIGGLFKAPRGKAEFNDLINVCALIEPPSCGNILSWCNGRNGGRRIWARLDRILVNMQFINLFEGSNYSYLPRSSSDHAPMLFLLFKKNISIVKPFRFLRMWGSHDGFLSLVEQSWGEYVEGCAMVRVSRKLKRLKHVLIKWNREVFGRVEVEINRLENQIQRLEENLVTNFSLQVEEEMVQAKKAHLQWVNREEMLACQKSRIKWLAEGDSNSKFFHAAMRVKKKNKIVDKMVLEDGRALESAEAVHLEAVQFYQSLFTGSNVSVQDPELALLSPVVTNAKNDALCRLPSEEEVYRAIRSIPMDSSPGPDGFSAAFFSLAWDIVKADIVDMAKEVFEGNPFSKFFGATNLVLIPKVEEPMGFGQFRPISLCSVVYKIMTKIMASRLAPILDKIISKEQVAFIPGRSIFDNMALAQELVQGLSRKVRGGNVMLKLDMAKAYDRVNWKFLLEILRRLGFSEKWRNLVFNTISSPFYSIMLNGCSKGFFQASRGVRQGDPLSPYLFILSQELLSRMLHQKFSHGIVKPFHPGGGTLVTHLLYADDVLIFTNGGRMSMRRLMATLHRYEKISGQLISPSKSTIFFPSHMSLARKNDLKGISGFEEGSWPCVYLGVPLYLGRLKISLFDGILARIQKKLAGWKSKMLSFGGKILLLRHVLNSMPIHILSVVKVPKAVFGMINKIFSDFLWGSSLGNKKRKWVAWHQMCKPVEEGGIGIRDLVEVQQSLFMKFGWKLVTGVSLWADFFREKYLRRDHVYNLMSKNKGSRFWKGIMEVMPRILLNSKWLIGAGNINFWMDNWLGGGPLKDLCPVVGSEHLQVAEVFDERGPKLDVLSQLVSSDIMQQIFVANVRLRPRADAIIWKISWDGNFTTKSAWEICRERGELCEWRRWLWLDKIPKKMSFLCWRLKRGVVPTDDVIQRLGIPLASKCHCCIESKSETLQHIMCEGLNAQMVWQYFANICQIRLPQIRNWKGMMVFWWRRAAKISQAGWIRGVMPIVISWCLWKARCSARMEGDTFKVNAIIRQVKVIIFNMSRNLKFFQVTKRHDFLVMEGLQVPIIPIKKKHVSFVKWELPRRGTMKLNVDGGARVNPGDAGGGGIIRDCSGRCIAGFAHHYGVATNTVAECRALLDGLRLCKNLGLHDVIVESDSKVVLSWLASGICRLWFLWDFWEEIRDISIEINARFCHVFREANMAADFLAKKGTLGENIDFFGMDFQYTRLRGLIRLDRMGMAYIREK
ncbi:uncharacterized protein LOC122298703 [Carya illinoinensis]|uniref:uncharacterized protein LOC122298703 n=1 Tax=Carya illinoinensis TaxID=32201 RepID=UPI001C718A5C|nr:uncharacterized protein LOC122298703 [Carya illinoinensis]